MGTAVCDDNKYYTFAKKIHEYVGYYAKNAYEGCGASAYFPDGIGGGDRMYKLDECQALCDAHEDCSCFTMQQPEPDESGMSCGITECGEGWGCFLRKGCEPTNFCDDNKYYTFLKK